MKCAWQAYLNLLPTWMRNEVDNLGKNELQELRLRAGRPPEMVLKDCSRYLEKTVSADDLSYCINAASRYSPWASSTVSSGYITAQGGHRIGICGDVVASDGRIRTIKNVTSLCIRVARDFPGIGLQAARMKASTLILGSPGRGKTTLLRDIIRQKSNMEYNTVAVVDERRELFPVAEDSFCFPPGLSTEVLSGCGKAVGVQMLIRTMNPRWIAVDEITAADDCEALIHAGWCGVSLLATAHAENLHDLMHRPVYGPLVSSRLFENIIVMQPDKSWKLERMNI